MFTGRTVAPTRATFTSQSNGRRFLHIQRRILGSWMECHGCLPQQMPHSRAALCNLAPMTITMLNPMYNAASGNKSANHWSNRPLDCKLMNPALTGHYMTHSTLSNDESWFCRPPKQLITEERITAHFSGLNSPHSLRGDSHICRTCNSPVFTHKKRTFFG